jgi:hypothetical protein
MLDGVHGDFDCVPDPFAKACCPGDNNFHGFPVQVWTLSISPHPVSTPATPMGILSTLGSSGNPGNEQRYAGDKNRKPESLSQWNLNTEFYFIR